MSFKELLKKYKVGTASPEEAKIVDQEIEKFEALEEYLTEDFEESFPAPFEKEADAQGGSSIQKSVNKRLRKVVAASVAAVMLLYLSIFYILSPIVDAMYYNPSRVSVGKHHSDLFFDLKAFTELNLPGYAVRGLVLSDRLGFGQHRIFFDRTNLFTQENQNVSAVIRRNSRIGSHEDFFGDSYFNFSFQIVRDPNLYEFDLYKNQKERVMNHVYQLHPTAYTSAYITFERDLSIEDYSELARKYNKVSFRWVGVRTAPADEPARYLTGFNPNPNDGSVTGDTADPKKYPYLQLVDWLSEKNNLSRYGMAEGYRLHYTSLLRFMADRPSAVRALEFAPEKSDYYQSALSYVEEKGVNVFGVLVYADSKDLIELVENEDIKTVELDSVLASRRYIH